MLIITTWLGGSNKRDWHTTFIAGAVFLGGVGLGSSVGSGGHDDSFLSDGPDAIGKLHVKDPIL